MSPFNLPLIQTYRPASFLERGVAVPFTTPQLAGARIRPAERTGTEFVVPNPAGGRGVYILHWGGIRQLCRPTVHDTLLHQRLSRLPVMDPRGVRLVTRQLAAEGMAGKDAATAAAATIAVDRQDRVLINFLLLITLMEQIEPMGLRASAATDRTPELDQRARRIVTRVGGAIGRGVEQIATDLAALSELFAAIGLDIEGPPCRLPRLAERLASAAAHLIEWAAECPEDGLKDLASSLGRAAHAAADCAAATLQAARDTTTDMSGLLQLWASIPDEIAKQLTRPEWVLDGWERFCLMWETTTSISAQRATLIEMAQLVPALPWELAAWSPRQTEPDAQEQVFRNTRVNTGFRGGGASFWLIARNERLQALIA